MPTETPSKVYNQSWPYQWPLEFTKRRNFERESENQAYIEFLQSRFQDVDDVSSSENESEVDEHRDDSEIEEENRNDDKDSEVYNRHYNVRLFMRGMIGDEDTLQYRDQVEQVAGFFEQASHRDFKTGSLGKSEKCVLLDDRNDGGTILKKGRCRPHLGPQTPQQLREALSRKRFRVNLDPKVPTNAVEDEESDAERRLIFITDLDASTIEALTATASRSQAPALKDLFYKYLMRKTSIGVNIRSKGFSVFTLDFHIPYYVLRVGKELLKDPREKSGGKPLRHSLDLPLLSKSMSTSTSTDKLYCLYEAQISVAVIGIDHWVWAAYCFVDTYFEPDEERESVDRYDQMTGCRGLGRADPFAAGQINASEPIWTPREYFLRVLEIRIKLVSREYHHIVNKVENAVKETRTHLEFPLSSDPKSRKKLQDFSRWNSQMMKQLRQLINSLSDAVGSWEEFQRNEIGYFLYDGDSPTTSLCIKPSIAAIGKVFSELNGLLRKLKDLRNELYVDYPQGLHAHLSHENNEAAIFQQKIAGHIQVFTVITIVYFPLVLAMSLFSTQGVLPFTPNLAYFICAIFILAVLVVATLVVLFNWDSWFQLVAHFMTALFRSPKAIIQNQGQKVKRDEDHDKISDVEGSRALELKPITMRYRKAPASRLWDLEEGIENGTGDPTS